MSRKTYKENLQEVFSGFIDYKLKKEQLYSSMATIVSVNDIDQTCEVEIVNGPVIDDCRLQQIEGDTGFFIKPAIGSVVLVSWSDNTTCFVDLFSEVSEIIYHGGSNGGLTITPKLVENLEKNNEILQILLNVLTGSPITEPGNGAPSALQTALSAQLATKAVGDFSNIENVKFKH